MDIRATLASAGVNDVTVRSLLRRVAQIEGLNFTLTNRIPRTLITRAFGWFSQLEQPQIRDASLAVWRAFTDVDLSDSATQEFKSLHDCFIRQLQPGARPLATDPAILTSPCDGIVGMCGAVEGTRAFQIKGSSYDLQELLVDPALAEHYRDGCYVTLRLTSAMYHRFHAPHDCTVERVTYVAGDTWNTNPIALRRVPKLYCQNEHAILRARLQGGELITLVPVAAILVASIRLHFLDVLLGLQHSGPNEFVCAAKHEKGQELGYFQHGSTLVAFAPQGFQLAEGLQTGQSIRMGQPLMRQAYTAS
jgi:phosphatidylserine decarboxylase